MTADPTSRRLRSRPETLLDAEGDRVVLGRYVGGARATGRPLAAFPHVLEFREGCVARHTQVTDSSRWANALGA